MYGSTTPAGLGVSTELATLDFETYSEAGCYWNEAKQRWDGPPGAPDSKRDTKSIAAVGAAVYAEHPTTEVLLLSYDLADGRGLRRWRPGQPLPTDLFDHTARGGLLEAHNNQFERWIWERVCTLRYGWPECPPIEQWRCSMSKCRAHALPGGLGEAGAVLGLDVQKGPDGKRLIEKFSVPQKPSRLDPRTRVELMLDQATIDETWHELTARDGLKPAEIRKLQETLADDVADTQRFVEYNDRDVVAESTLSHRVPDLSSMELRFWQDDQRINRRGVQIDLAAVHDCCAILDQALRQYGDEMQAITGRKPTEVQKLIGWLAAFGVYADKLDEDSVEALLDDRAKLPPHVVRALEIRATVGSASVKKVYAMRARTTRAGRLHDAYLYHGARTGRPTGDGVQSTNLPKAGPHVHRCGYVIVAGKEMALPTGCGRWHGSHTTHCPWCQTMTVRGPKDAREWNPAAVKDALAVISHRSLSVLETFFGHALLTIAGCLRGLFIAAPGCELISSDFTAIEGVVIAALADEKWRLDVYAGETSIYIASASRAFGVPVEEFEAHKRATGMHHPLRDKGKRMELGLGFGGWVNALRSRQIRYPGTDDELKDAILKWRAASPNIEWLWGGQTRGSADGVRLNAGRIDRADRWDRAPEYFGLEGAAISAVLHAGTVFPVLRMDGSDTGVAYMMRDDVLYCRVPSGGLITYHRPRLQKADQDWRGLSLTYEGWNTNPKNGPPGWQTMPLYGGRAAENVVQKTARDIQMSAIHRLERNGYPVVMHTYDENVAEVPVGAGSVTELELHMTTPLPWTAGWPIKAAGGWRDDRYCKA